jgi:flagellar biogenesis protein FliO
MMPCPRFFLCLLFCLTLVPRAGWADDTPSHLPGEAGRHRIPPHLKIDRNTPPTSVGNGGWWVGSVALALCLIGLGAASLAAKRYATGPGELGRSIRVIGRTSLTPKHVVHLVKVADRVLLFGTGPQGAPSLLGELDELEEPVADLSQSSGPIENATRLLSSLARRSGGTT